MEFHGSDVKSPVEETIGTAPTSDYRAYMYIVYVFYIYTHTSLYICVRNSFSHPERQMCVWLNVKMIRSSWGAEVGHEYEERRSGAPIELFLGLWRASHKPSDRMDDHMSWGRIIHSVACFLSPCLNRKGTIALEMFNCQGLPVPPANHLVTLRWLRATYRPMKARTTKESEKRHGMTLESFLIYETRSPDAYQGTWKLRANN